MRNAWSDLFVLGMAQCSKAMNLQTILNAIVNHLQSSVNQDKLTASRVKQVTTTILKVQEYVRAMAKMNIDDSEFAYLKTIALFSAGNNCTKVIMGNRDQCFTIFQTLTASPRPSKSRS